MRLIQGTGPTVEDLGVVPPSQGKPRHVCTARALRDRGWTTAEIEHYLGTTGDLLVHDADGYTTPAYDARRIARAEHADQRLAGRVAGRAAPALTLIAAEVQ